MPDTFPRTPTLMQTEAAEAPRRAAEQIALNNALMQAAGSRLRALAPPFAATLARGSSDQAASFAKFLLETHAAIPTLSHAPSVGALYGATSPHFRGVPLIAISQSGRSPDLLAAADDAKRHGAIIVAVVNDEASPLAERADIVIPIRAGAERSVAATKTFICTLVALTHLVAEWSQNRELLRALPLVEAVLTSAAETNWSAAEPILRHAGRMLVLGRGPTLAIAGEAALKLKETSGIYAEAFSVAEVAHGPMTLINRGDPVLVLGPLDAARSGLAERMADFAARGARLIAAGHPGDIGQAEVMLPSAASAHPVLAAIAQIQSFYGLVPTVAVARGRDPDTPPHLNKVTLTL